MICAEACRLSVIRAVPADMGDAEVSRNCFGEATGEAVAPIGDLKSLGASLSRTLAEKGSRDASIDPWDGTEYSAQLSMHMGVD